MSKSDHLILAGPPNSGKTTLFNWLTGYNKKTVNYPGSTVDVAFGAIHHSSWKAIDTPGFYSLFPPGQESKAFKNILKEVCQKKELRGVILVLDATRLRRQLPLLFQLKSMNLPILLALTMYDIQKKSAGLDIKKLSKELNLPVCPIEGLLGGGVKELLKTAQKTFQADAHAPTAAPITSQTNKNLAEEEQPWSSTQQKSYLQKAEDIVNRAVTKTSEKKIGRKTKQVDAWLLHPLFGFAFLSAILFLFFSGIFWLAAPLMELIDNSVSLLSEKCLSWKEDSLIVDFLANGVLTGFGAFLVFAPQVFILFLGIYLLEDSGYLARAVSLVDGPFAKIGLSGKSLFPFLSGFACAIPAVLSARSISSKKQRWITIFVIPFMTCSARLPVYALLLSFLFYGDSAWKPGIVMALLYFLSLLLGIASAGILNLFSRAEKKSSFLMELPLYRKPMLSNLLTGAWSKTKHFIWKAGPVIFVFSLLMWGAVHFPRSPDLPPSAQIKNSYAGQAGQAIEPLFETMGGDWRIGVSLLSAFVAREVFVSVLAVVLKSTETESSQKLIQTMKNTKMIDGKPLFTTASVMALLVFFLFSLQCLSTTGIVYKETGSWVFSAVQLIALNGMGYLGAVCTYWCLS